MWVDYILTTANSWKTPIKKFELVVEKGSKREGYDDDWDYASLCWDGPAKRVDAHHFEASATDFVPKRELKVLFLTMPEKAGGDVAAPPQPVITKRSFEWVFGLGTLLLGLATVWGWRRLKKS